MLACSRGQNIPMIMEQIETFRMSAAFRIESARYTNLYDTLSGGDVLRNFNTIYFLFEHGRIIVDIVNVNCDID